MLVIIIQILFKFITFKREEKLLLITTLSNIDVTDLLYPSYHYIQGKFFASIVRKLVLI